MQTVKIELETVTPLFLSGANQQESELRAPALRGALRYWLRALLGSQYDSTQTFEEESQVFGNTEQRSAIGVRLIQTSKKPLWSKSGEPGIKYLLFAMRSQNGRPPRQAIGAETTFDLTLTQLQRPAMAAQGTNADPLVRGLQALWLLTYLGGVGARSRRGFGSVIVRNVSSSHDTTTEIPPLAVTAKTPQELATHLQEGITRLRLPVRTITETPDFDILHPAYCRIAVARNTWIQWKDALNALGLALKSFRETFTSERHHVGDALLNRADAPATIERAALGLPIEFYYSRNEKSVLEGVHHGRRASPLHMQVTQLANGKYTIVLTCFKAALLGHHEQLKLSRINRVHPNTMSITPPDLHVLDTCFDYFQNNEDQQLGGLLEVTL